MKKFYDLGRGRPALVLAAGLGGLVTVACVAHAQTWTRGAPPDTNNTVAMALAASADGMKLVGVWGPNGYSNGDPPAPLLCTSTNAGLNWMPVEIPCRHWTCVASSADGTRLAAAAGPFQGELMADHYPGGIFISVNSGLTWTSTSAPTNSAWTSIASSADGTKLLAASGFYGNGGGVIHRSLDSGATWTLANAPSQSWVSVAMSADGIRMVAVDGGQWQSSSFVGGRIYRSSDAGATWNKTSAPINGWSSVAMSADGVKLIAAAYGEAWQPSGYVSDGLIFTSIDFGETWTASTAPSSGWSRVASSADGTKLAAAPGSGIYISTDSGLTWTMTSAAGGDWQSLVSSADGSMIWAGAFFDTDLGGNNAAFGILSAGPLRISSPSLSITRDGNYPILSWLVPSTPSVLQQRLDLAANWTSFPAPPTLNLTNLHQEVALPQYLANPHSFYRLKRE